MKKKLKILSAVVCFGVMLLGFWKIPIYAFESDSVFEEDLPKKQIWKNEGDTLEQAVEVHNVDVWAVEDYELDTMYQDPYVLRRTANTTEAWVVFELPYMKRVELLSYSWTENAVPFVLYLSEDGETWTDAGNETEVRPDPEELGRWTQILHQNENTRGMRYLKIVWPQPSASNDWWNPYLGWISAEIGVPSPAKLVTFVPEALTVPRYDNTVYSLSANVIDQLGEAMEFEIVWCAAEELPEGVTLTADGTLTVEHTCMADTKLQLTAKATITETETMEASVWTVFRPAQIGDSNYDNKLDEADLQYVMDNYGKSQEDEEWKNLRLVDVDGDGKIDIADLAYLAYYCEIKQDDVAENQ